MGPDAIGSDCRLCAGSNRMGDSRRRHHRPVVSSVCRSRSLAEGAHPNLLVCHLVDQLRHALRSFKSNERAMGCTDRALAYSAVTVRRRTWCGLETASFDVDLILRKLMRSRLAVCADVARAKVGMAGEAQWLSLDRNSCGYSVFVSNGADEANCQTRDLRMAI